LWDVGLPDAVPACDFIHLSDAIRREHKLQSGGGGGDGGMGGGF
jgi:hypothetical protein